MSRLMKFLLFVLVLIVVAVVAAIVYVQTQVTSERVRAYLLPVVEQSLQRKVTFGDIEIGLFSGVSVADLSVQQKSTEDDFIAVDELQFHYRLLSLLKGKIDIDRIVLSQPRIKVIRQHDGRFNFSDLLSSSETGSEKTQASDGVATDLNSIGLQLLVQQVRVENAVVEFTDYLRNQSSPYRHRLDNFNFNAEQITLEEAFPIELSADFNGAPLGLSGHYNIASQSADLVIVTDGVDLVPLAPYFRDHLPLKLASALLSSNMELKLDNELLQSKGRIGFDRLDFSMRSGPARKLKDIALTIDYAASFQRNNEKLDVTTLMVDLNGLQATGSAHLALAGPDPELKAEVNLNQIDLRHLMELLPTDLADEYRSYSPAGLMSANFKLDGKLSQGKSLLEQGRLSLDGVKVSVENTRAGVSGDLLFKGSNLNAKGLQLSYGGLEAVSDVSVTRLFDNVPAVDFKLKADRLNIDSLLSSAPDSNSSGSAPQVAGSSAAGPVDIPVTLKGRVDAATVVVNNLDLNQVGFDVLLRDNKLRLSNITALLNNSPVAAEVQVNLGLKKPVSSGSFSLTQTDIDPLFQALLPQRQEQMNGAAVVDSTFSSTGLGLEQGLTNLSLKGRLSLDNAVVKGAPVLASIASFLGYEEQELLSFRSMSTDYDLKDGVANLVGQLRSSKIELDPKGTVTTTGELNLKLPVRLSPTVKERISDSDRWNELPTDSNGWTRVPLVIKGTVDRPLVSIDSDEAQKLLLEKAKNKATEKLLDKIPIKNQEPIRELLDNTLDKLFNQ